MQQTSYVPTTDPNDWILPAPGPTTWDNSNRYGPHGDGTPLPEHPVKIGTPTPATMTLFSVYSITAIVCTVVAVASMMSQDDYEGDDYPYCDCCNWINSNLSRIF